jgi:NTE family protein
LLVAIAHAQNRIPDASRPTIGVALEGGGAKGLAHIGVLEWFEEHHIPIDYIAGTSMGGLVGGLYATGLRPAEIREIVNGINWDEVLAGQTPYEALAFRRKEDFRAYPNRLELGLRGGISMPGGLTSGQGVRSLLDRYLLPYSEPKSFDELPVPFRCVATDLVTGKAEVFSSGSISNALRATMSLPGVFAPVKSGNKVYADGGLLNNLPTDVVKQMGADVVIGVHLSVGPIDPTKLRTLFQVAGGSTGAMIDANVMRGMELADLLLTVDVAGYTTLDFSRAGDIIGLGRKAAEARAAVLNRFRLGDDDWSRHMARQQARRVPSAQVVQFVEVEGIDKDLGGYVSKRLAHYEGQPLDTKSLESDLTRLVGIGRFNSLTYNLTKRGENTGLLITAEEKDYSPPWLKPGFVVDGADPDNVGFAFATRVTFLDVGGYRSELRTDFAVGSTYGVRTEYYRPLNPLSRWFIAPSAGARRTPLNLYSKSNLLAEYRLNSAFGGIDAGYNFDRFSELRFGYQAGYASANMRIGSPLLPSVSGRTGSTRLRFAMDRLDNPIIPRRGVALLATAEWIDANPGSQDSFPSAEIAVMGFRRVSKPGSVYGLISGGTTFGSDQTGIPQFSLGGPGRLAAYGLNEFLLNQYAYGRGGYLHQIGALPSFLGGGVYLNTHFEIAKPYNPGNTLGLAGDAVFGVATETLFGPLMIGGSIGDSGHRRWFFQLGKLF